MIGYLFILATTLLYFYVLKKFQYFKNKGIPYQPGYFPLGSSITWKALSGQVAFFGIPDEIYKIYPEHKVVSIMVKYSIESPPKLVACKSTVTLLQFSFLGYLLKHFLFYVNAPVLLFYKGRLLWIIRKAHSRHSGYGNCKESDDQRF